LLAASLSALGCRVSAAQVEVVAPTTSTPERSDRCDRFAGPPGDLDLRGQARDHPTRCCPSDYGFEPELARQSCGFTEYLGESEELACVHRFRGADRQVHELRITPVVDLSFVAAVELHGQGEFVAEHHGEAPEQLPGLWWSASEGRRWAYVPGWSIVRRLGWDEDACAAERMQPVLAAMLAATDDPAAAVALPRMVTSEAASGPTPNPSLLERERNELEANRRYPLPHAAERLIGELLTAAASSPARLAELVEADARIGLADRRLLGARSLLADDDGSTAAALIVRAAARFPADTPLLCAAIDRRVVPQITRGEAWMWCMWTSEDALDLLVFGLRGHVHDGEADARVAYVGLFPDRPLAPLLVPGEPPPPPLVLTPELVCGDPHARLYPGMCTTSEDDEDDDSDDSDDQP
jgi:hypothetical protein